MNFDPGIICFTHCSTSIFCIQVPHICPLCQQSLTDNSIMPFSCYSVKSDLHVGISASTGDVFEFDSTGLSSSNDDGWNQCLVIYQLKDTAWYHRWNNVLRLIYDRTKFSSKTYNEKTHNCYSFVLAFVHELRHEDFKNACESKEVFCQKFVVPRLKDAIKYVSLFRNLKNYDSNGVWH